jgi:hypothetical protein
VPLFTVAVTVLGDSSARSSTVLTVSAAEVAPASGDQRAPPAGMTDPARRDAGLIQLALAFSRAAAILLQMGCGEQAADLAEAAARLLGMVGRG